jgi:hypothetical protein
MVDFFVFFAILMVVVIVALGGVLTWSLVAQTQFKVGDIVRTTFTGCPTALTVALWGANADYVWRTDSALDTYGFNGRFDAGNALHCDVHGAGGTYSTWLQSSGANFKSMVADHQDKYGWLGSGTQRYFTGQTCSTSDDCVTNTQIPCGPGFLPPFALSLTWDDSDRTNPDKYQCPTVSRCSVLDGLTPGSTEWNALNTTESTKTGVCIANEGEFDGPLNLLQSCSTIYPPDPLVTESLFKYCNSYVVDPSIAPADSQRGCSKTEDYAAGNFCNGVNKPFYCNFAPGNAMCLLGQTCTTNTGQTQTWSNNLTDSHICSGTVMPDIAMQFPWIAEGTISKVNGKGTSYNVDWHRVALQYEGIGPSDLTCPVSVDGKTDKKCKITPETRADKSWKYSDCRFILADEPPPSSLPPNRQRHVYVKTALLGSPDANPKGLGIFSNTIWSDYSLYGFHLLSASLYVGKFPSNPMSREKLTTDTTYSGANGWRKRAANEYFQTVWDLSSVEVPKEKLSKIFFYSILPVDTGSETDAHHEDTVAKLHEMRQTVRNRSKLVRGYGLVTAAQGGGGVLYQ